MFQAALILQIYIDLDVVPLCVDWCPWDCNLIAFSTEKGKFNEVLAVSI